jgi:hypothetical protein
MAKIDPSHEEGDVMSDYPPAVAGLLTLGEIDWGKEWLDYRARGIGPEHVPDLIRMMLDRELNEGDPESDEVWAPLHAMRALGQLRAVEACEALLQAVREDRERDGDWVSEEAPDVFGMIGPPALPVLAAALRDNSLDEYLRWNAADSIKSIADHHPEAREECVAVLTGHLEHASESDPTVNGGVIGNLLDLEAVESAPVIERAFVANAVDESIAGDWEYVRYELGLGPPPARPFHQPGFLIDRPVRSPKTRAQQRAKNRKKQARKSKKRNRKKK